MVMALCTLVVMVQARGTLSFAFSCLSWSHPCIADIDVKVVNVFPSNWRLGILLLHVYVLVYGCAREAAEPPARPLLFFLLLLLF